MPQANPRILEDVNLRANEQRWDRPARTMYVHPDFDGIVYLHGHPIGYHAPITCQYCGQPSDNHAPMCPTQAIA